MTTIICSTPLTYVHKHIYEHEHYSVQHSLSNTFHSFCVLLSAQLTAHILSLLFTYLQSISSVSSNIHQLPAYVPVCVRTFHAALTMLYLPCCTYYAVCTFLGLDNKGWNISNIPKFVPCQEILPRGNAIPLFFVHAWVCVCVCVCLSIDMCIGRHSHSPTHSHWTLSFTVLFLSLSHSHFPLPHSLLPLTLRCSLSLSLPLLYFTVPSLLSFSSNQESRLPYAWPDSSRWVINRYV